MAKTNCWTRYTREFAPKFAELNDDVLFGAIWAREEELSPRDRKR